MSAPTGTVAVMDDWRDHECHDRSPVRAPADRPLTVAETVYAEFGIPAYWIVVPDPDKPFITADSLTAGGYADVGHAAGEQRFVATTPFPVDIVPAELVAGRWRH
jgi:hypothetical protein